MRLRTPRVTRTYTLFPNTTLFRSWTDISATLAREDMAADTAMAGPELDGVRENLTVTVLEDRTLGAYENHAHADLSYLSDDIAIGDRVRIDGLTAAHARAEIGRAHV